jgi:hypothetical protein
MPVYICQAGSSSSEPWRHGLQVYAAPFALNDVPVGSSNSARGGAGEGEEDDDNPNPNVTIAPPLVPSTRQEIDNNNNNDQQQQREREDHQEDEIRDEAATDATSGGPIHNTTTSSGRSQRDDDLLASIHSAKYGLPVRRIRHAEVVLVDDVCIAFDRHWLRLRWPGTKGGFAGYVALGKVDNNNNNNSNEPQLSLLNNNRVQTSSGDLLVQGMCIMVSLIIGVRASFRVCIIFHYIFN